MESNIEKLITVRGGKDAEKYFEKVLATHMTNLNKLAIILNAIVKSS